MWKYYELPHLAALSGTDELTTYLPETVHKFSSTILHEEGHAEQ